MMVTVSIAKAVGTTDSSLFWLRECITNRQISAPERAPCVSSQPPDHCPDGEMEKKNQHMTPSFISKQFI